MFSLGASRGQRPSIALSRAIVFVFLSAVLSCGGDSKGNGTLFQVQATVNGLAGSGLTLQVNGGPDISVDKDSSPVLAWLPADGSYDVEVKTQPIGPWQTCVVADGKGTIRGAGVTVMVTCTTNQYAIGGTITGYRGSGLELSADGQPDLSVESGANSFQFSNRVDSGSSYPTVSVKQQPHNPLETCTPVNIPSSKVGGVDVEDISIFCVGTGCPTGYVDLDGKAENGCEYQCTEQGETETPGDTFNDINCDGVDGDVDQAIFVAATGTDCNSVGCGTRLNPVKTISYALTLAAGPPVRSLYIQEGTYSESATLTVPQGVSIYGGYQANGPWGPFTGARTGTTTLNGAATAVSVNGGTNQTIDHLTITSANATGVAQSSIGIVATNTVGLTLSALAVTAGNGTNGAAGTVGSQGASGGNGSVTTGGTSQCSPGGAGGSGYPGTGSPGAGGACGGTATNGGNGCAGTSATAPGTPGSQGLAGLAFSGSLFIPSSGGTGSPGGDGTGGGGGVSGAPGMCGGPSGSYSTGGNPSGGGAGGAACGGTGGGGGQQGGASIGILLVAASGTVIKNCTVRSGTAGSGGSGGAGGSPGTRGTGAAGDTGPSCYCGGSASLTQPCRSSGKGGDGGSATAGGAGGGGAGGPSISLVYSSSTPPTEVGTNTYTSGSGGASGSSPGGNAGEAGISLKKSAF